jgi:hypothetical protein
MDVQEVKLNYGQGEFLFDINRKHYKKYLFRRNSYSHNPHLFRYCGVAYFSV